jgi:riboflavin kinase/FMN adenylyltransferase
VRDAALESIAVGFFDGVHLGHQAILGRASRALTFGNHPLSVLAPERAPRLIMTPEEKVAAIRACGVGEVEVVDFTPELAALSPEEFAARHFVGRDGSRRSVVCGENWRFGAGGRGDADFLRRLGFEVEVVPYAVFGGERVSSSRIRRSLAEGDIAAVASMTGRPVFAEGTRFAGKGRGAAMGFPTVNLRLGASPASLLPLGAYAVEACGAAAVANYGKAPTMGEAAWDDPVLELHFVDAMPDLQADRVRVEFRRFLRPERKFATLDDLRRQIAADVASVRSGRPS